MAMDTWRLALAGGLMVCSVGPAFAQSAKIVYPQTRTDSVVDDYHGTKVADPYRWLEDDNSPETAAWVQAQNKVTFAYLEAIPERSKIKDQLTTLWNYEKYGTPFKEGGQYFYSYNTGLQNQSVTYVTGSLAEKGRVLIDPNTLKADGTAALAGMAISEDGRHMAYAIAEAGSDWNVWKVREISTGKDLPDELRWVKFSGASWAKDGSGFYYSRYDEPKPGAELDGVNYYQKVFFHKVGTAQTQDTLVYKRDDQKEWGFGAGVTEDGKYLIINVSQGTDPKNRVFYKELGSENAPVVELLNEFDASYDFVGNDGPVFWFRTDLNAPRGRLIAIDTRAPARQNWKELVPQAVETLQGVNCVGDKFFASYLKDARTQVKVFALNGEFDREVKFPGLGSAGGFGGKRTDTETFYSFTSYTMPPTIYRYDVKSGISTVFKSPAVKFDGSKYETVQKFYTSKDGTKVPVFITHKKGLALDGNNPTLLYGYGGFNIPLTPGFSPATCVWLEMGGVYAVANLRGGGEYGEEWHQAGTKLKKQNVFDDCIAAAEFLVKEKYTSPGKLAIQGGSNGGLLVGAVINQRPDLFGAALPAVGVMDMLRFHLFTIGWAWKSDYGSSENADEFKALHAYSPYHNLKKGTKFPAVMVTTADHDDRVVPAHSFKYAAALQAAHAGEAPVLIRIDVRAGHGAGKPTSKRIEEVADQWAFLAKNLGMYTN